MSDRTHYEGCWREHSECAVAMAEELLRELRHLTRLLEPMEASGALNVPGLATLNGARTAIAKATGQKPEHSTVQ